MTALWTSISQIWSAIASWFVEVIPDMEALFWDSTNSSLTLLGVLAVVSVGIGLVFLCVGIIQNFLHLRS